MSDIRCENCDQVVRFARFHWEERHISENGIARSWGCWSCAPENWRARALKAEATLANAETRTIATLKMSPPLMEEIGKLAKERNMTVSELMNQILGFKPFQE